MLTAIGVFVLYFYGLDRAGMLGPDEPRYSAIGREMAASGDWVTPRLWGEPWFEKPALTYWLTGIGFQLGLDEELAPRLPVALISVVFLAFFYTELKRYFGEPAALYGSAILATSAGWIAFSYVGVTDLPLAAAFSGALFLAMERNPRRELGSGILLGVAILAKGLVPLVLAAPLFLWLMIRRRWMSVVVVVVAAILTAAPWYTLCTIRNGSAFINEFFWKHHFQRFATDVLQHRQPFWFYLPVLLGAVFPWTALIALVPRANLLKNSLLLLLGGTVLFGFVFFSLSVNKLPGYVLPLVPALAAVMGVQLAAARQASWILAAVALSLLVYPFAGDVLPRASADGLSRAQVTGMYWPLIGPAALLAWQCWRMDRAGKRSEAMIILLVVTAAAIVYLKASVLPRVDSVASARPIWRRLSLVKQFTCREEGIGRSWEYGLNYYFRGSLPACNSSFPIHLSPGPTGRPIILQSDIVR